MFQCHNGKATCQTRLKESEICVGYHLAVYLNWIWRLPQFRSYWRKIVRYRFNKSIHFLNEPPFLGHPFFDSISSPRPIKSKCRGKLYLPFRPSKEQRNGSHNILQIMVYHTENQDAINQKSIPSDPSQFISIIIKNIFLLALWRISLSSLLSRIPTYNAIRLWWPAPSVRRLRGQEWQSDDHQRYQLIRIESPFGRKKGKHKILPRVISLERSERNHTFITTSNPVRSYEFHKDIYISDSRVVVSHPLSSGQFLQLPLLGLVLFTFICQRIFLSFAHSPLLLSLKGDYGFEL